MDPTLKPVTALASSQRNDALPTRRRQRPELKVNSGADLEKAESVVNLKLWSRIARAIRAISGSTQEPVESSAAAKERNTQMERANKWLSIFREFSLGGPQSLTSVLSKINEAKTAMTMNIRMSEDLRSYYKDMFEFGQVVEATARSSASAHQRFQRAARSLERQLQMECLRADALVEKVRTHANLYDMILQADNREFAKLYSFRAETVTERMYDIAKTTERDTSSMHVITLFTLLFLPGTFVAVRLITRWDGTNRATLMSV
ncbi:hypothetical protein E8E14_014848 [Neopestalotiopsis sp. 37M]|nr:hypothetical protein E8E14_014848 [Neopestalotiopsis sp. 37M]